MDMASIFREHRERMAATILKLDAETAQKLLHWLVLHNQPPGLDSHLAGRNYLSEEFLKQFKE